MKRMRMKPAIFILATLLGGGTLSESSAQDTKNIVPDISVERFKMDRSGRYLAVRMEVDWSELHVNSTRAVLLTPRFINGSDSLDLPSIGIYGRRRYYYYMRNGRGNISGENEISRRASQKTKTVSYHNPIPYEEWMNGAELRFHRSDWGCCRAIVAEYDGLLGQHSEAFFPELIYVRPEAETMKSRSLSGSAFIDFPVDETIIYPGYRQNMAELI